MRALIIGGGIAGCSTAYALAKRGIEVTLLERNAALCSEASGNPNAMLYPRLSGADDLSTFALAGYLYSLQLYKSLPLTSAEFKQSGMLQLGFNARELSRIKKVAQTYPHICRLVSSEIASQLSGVTVLHDALYFPEAGWVQPSLLQQQLTQYHNISTKTLTKVNNILKIKDIFKVTDANNQSFEADIVIIANANDARTFEQSGLISTQAVRGQVSLLSATPASKQLNTIICSDGYLSPAIDNTHSLGASYSAENTDLTLNAADHASNLQKLAAMSPALYPALTTPAQPIAGRASFRCTTPDYFPLLGQLLDSTALHNKPPRPSASTQSLAWHDGLYINVGHGSKGFTSAPLCAELLAALICQEPLPIDAAIAGLLNPNRFLLRQMGLKRLAKTVAISS